MCLHSFSDAFSMMHLNDKYAAELHVGAPLAFQIEVFFSALPAGARGERISGDTPETPPGAATPGPRCQKSTLERCPLRVPWTILCHNNPSRHIGMKAAVIGKAASRCKLEAIRAARVNGATSKRAARHRMRGLRVINPGHDRARSDADACWTEGKLTIFKGDDRHGYFGRRRRSWRGLRGWCRRRPGSRRRRGPGGRCRSRRSCGSWRGPRRGCRRRWSRF